MVEDVPFLGGWIAVQTLPRLAERVGVAIDLPSERMLYGLEFDQLGRVISGYESRLKGMLREHGITWWDVYEASDVGKERLELIEELDVSREDFVLDACCGKGYTTAALARRSSMVCGLDLMNGYGRNGWWKDFRVEMFALGLDQAIGLRANAAMVPLEDGKFTLAVSVHALRNIGNVSIIVDMLKEMRRITRVGGRVIVAENLPVARTKAQEAHLRFFNLKTRLVRGDRPYYSEAEMVGMFEEAGLEISRRTVLDFGLSAAPPIFSLDAARYSPTEKASIEEEFEAVVEMIHKHGESSPPVLILEANV